MIAGIFFRRPESQHKQAVTQRLFAQESLEAILLHDRLLLACGMTDSAKGMPALQPFRQDGDRLSGCWFGTIANRKELEASLENSLPPGAEDSRLFLFLYERFGEVCVEKINGNFAFVLYDALTGRLLLCRDRLGIESLYYSVHDDYLAFASTLSALFLLTGQEKQINPLAVNKFLLFNYNPGLATFFRNAERLPPAHFLRVVEGRVSLDRYWSLIFAPAVAPEEETAHQLLSHLRRAVSRRVDNGSPPGIFLSGGMDSSTVLALTRENFSETINTFSYRCRAVSFDESKYARIMAEFAHSSHHESEFRSDDVLLMPGIVEGMNEPFCDVGINIATFLLGREASGSKSRYILTGDGGDELFAGHPVYEADKLAAYLNPIPQCILAPLLQVCALLPDSDQKKNLSVKLKRFAESLAHPRELLSHRWRIYYTEKEFKGLLHAESLRQLSWAGLLEDILRYNEEGNGPDLLSSCLYSDYQTAVDFYLRRNDLNRRLGLETRFPLLDHELVEFCATIPSSLKIRKWFDTKYIFKKAMEGVLPHGIIYREDKLGHSIPLKNWIRDDPKVREFICDHVSPTVIKKRGLFHGEAIAKLTNDHLAKRRNNSHRLWALAVLEMWMRHNLDH